MERVVDNSKVDIPTLKTKTELRKINLEVCEGAFTLSSIVIQYLKNLTFS